MISDTSTVNGTVNGARADAGRNTEAIAAELQRIVDQAEELLSSVGVDSEQLSALRERVSNTIGAAKSRLADLERQTRSSSKRAARATDTWVRSNPWTALAIGAGIGLIIGAAMLMGRGSSDEVDDE